MKGNEEFANGEQKFVYKKYGMGVLYLLTGGLFLVGWLVDVVKAIWSFVDSCYDEIE